MKNDRQHTGRKTIGLSTASVHAGELRKRAENAITTPIIQTSTYTFANTAEVIDYHEEIITREEYGRYGNPTVRAAERKISCLEAGERDDIATLLYSTGMNAVTTAILSLLSAGDHIVLTDDCYRKTRQFVQQCLVRLGITHTIVAACDYEGMEAAIRPETRLLLSESPTNPYLRVLDLEQVAAIAHRHRLISLIDASFATPYNIRPLEYGIDLVLHSATKYLGGHNDLLCGSITGNAELIKILRDYQGIFGGICDPNTAYLLLRGMKTFVLRMERHNANGLAVARFLEQHPRVLRTHYPGLPSHPDHTIAVRQMRGWGGVVSFEIDGDLQTTSHFIDALRLPYIAPSFGGVESMVIQPALMSFYDLTPAQRLEIGIRGNLVRFSCGIEDAEDIIADLAQALDQLPPAS